MKGKKRNLSLAALALVAICGRVPTALAVTTIIDTMNYEGAIFTLGGEWEIERSIYTMTYTAQFGPSQNPQVQSYLKAIDWKWDGGTIDTVALLEAPGGKENWNAQTSRQIGGEAAQCLEAGDSNAVCTEFNGLGLSTSDTGLLSWVFEISFKDFNQQESFLGGGVRSAYVTSGSLAAPVMRFFEPLPETTNVPVPGVPALLLIGLAGLSLCRASAGKASNKV